MILSNKTIEKLRDLINDETEYRSGPKLVTFFNQLGFNDVYAGGFPSRWAYTEDKLNEINGTPEIDKCIKSLFAPINYIGKFTELDAFITEFNQYLAFDKWKVVRKNEEIQITRADYIDIDIDKAKLQEIGNKDLKESEFLKKEFGIIEIEKLPIDSALIPILDLRITEIKNCIGSKAFLAAIILMGSTLEGILLGMASENAKLFNQSNSAPKDKNTDKVFPFSKWNLNNFIDVAYEIGCIHLDVKKFSHGLREFRNYIHPYQQLTERFTPNEQTATICYQVLKAAIVQIISFNKQKI